MVLITCLSNVATQVGVGRIIGGSKFHYPVGNPDLPAEAELNWRVDLMEKALEALETPVASPAIFQAPGNSHIEKPVRLSPLLDCWPRVS